MMSTLMTYLICLVPQDKVSTWPLQGLNRELNNIAHLESHYGRNVNHRAHARGPFHTAFGSLGLKPVTAYTTFASSQRLQKQFPNLLDGHVFLNEFLHNKELYTQCANHHWWTLRHATSTLARAVYAWRWGLTAANKATDEQINSDSYTQRYAELTQHLVNANTLSRR